MRPIVIPAEAGTSAGEVHLRLSPHEIPAFAGKTPAGLAEIPASAGKTI